MNVTQSSSRLMTGMIRTCLKYAQSQQKPLSMHMNNLRAAATCCVTSSLCTAAGASSALVVSIPSPSALALLTPQQMQSLLPQRQFTTALAATTNSISSIAPLRRRTYSKFTTGTGVGMQHLNDERATDLIINLKDSERAAIKDALQKYEAMIQKESYEGKLAASQWRTRFGRITKPGLGTVDPSGSFCTFPADWLKKKAAETAKRPKNVDLWKIFTVNAVPFVAFGFLDNFIMILAGDYIESMFDSYMCISTMAAAGLGNTFSDIMGIGSAYYVERGCEILGFKQPDLSPAQIEMKISRVAANYGRIIGITCGCIIGMFPLLFMDNKKETEKAEKVNVKTA